MNRDPLQIIAGPLGLAGVNADPKGQPEVRHGGADRFGAVHRPNRTVEGGQEAVTGGLDLPALVSIEGAAHEVVVGQQTLMPSSITIFSAVAVESTMSVKRRGIRAK